MSDTPTTTVKEPPPIAYPESARSLQRRTRQVQETIAEIIRELPRGVHLTAPEVYRRAKEQGLQISLSTVYRALASMQADGNVTTVSGEHGRRYEARDEDHDHDHLICLKCGLTIEFADELIRGFGKAVAERKGYDHKSSRFDIYGICSTCKAKDEDHKISSCISSLETAKERAEETLAKLETVIALLQTRKVARAGEGLSAAIQQLREACAEAENAAEVLLAPVTES